MSKLKIVILMAFTVQLSYGGLGSPESNKEGNFTNLIAEASDIFIGVATSITYFEEDRPINYINKRDWLSYKISFLPVKILKGKICPFSIADVATSEKQEITVLYRDGSPFFSWDSPTLCHTPIPGLSYIVFLKTSTSNSFELCSIRNGVLPVDPMLVKQNPSDVWQWLILTVKSQNMPLGLHDTVVNALLSYDQDKGSLRELLDAHVEFLIHYKDSCTKRLENARNDAKGEENAN